MDIMHINTTLLFILLILIIFCVLYLVYNGINLDSLIYYDTKIDNMNNILEILSDAKIHAQNKLKSNSANINSANINRKLKEKLKEKFVIDMRLLQENDADNYNRDLSNLQSWIDNSLKGPDGILTRLRSELNNTNNLRKEKRDKLIDELANVYLLGYINQLDKANAESYKVYLNFKSPEDNKYYQQYLR